MNKNISMRPLSTFPSWIECRKLPEDAEGSANPDESYCSGRVGHVAVSIMDELLVWGGYFERGWGSVYCSKSEVWNYSLDMDCWFRYFPHGTGPHHTSGACSAVVWPYWYILCGHLSRGHTNHIFRLNLLTCTFETVVPNGNMICPRDKTVSWVLDSRIFVFGGYGGAPLMCHLWNRETDVYARESWEDDRGWNNQLASFDTVTQEWKLVETQGPRPLARAAHTAVRVDMAVYIFGGRNMGQRMGDLHKLDLQDFTWSGELCCQGPKPEGRSWHIMARINKQNLILMGGYNDFDQILDDLWMLNVESLSWSLLDQHTCRPRLWHTACTNSMGDLLIFGGCINNILDSTIRMETSDHVLAVRLEPYSLERLCLHELWKNRYVNWSSWACLSQNFRKWLEQRQQSSSDLNRRIYRCQAIAIYGPNLRHLSVLQPEQADFINMNILELERVRSSRHRVH
ncbi:hypothetical protein RRG08_033690 [Elysia crispata]|uniref:F-box/kelch-repeat protein n=1 Tax=Elysia crispata TaxID=231223 RepID=A0AAE1A9F4_9GAST|nr:hypothetical protein RRG08_033690 [Elysia crispata]